MVEEKRKALATVRVVVKNWANPDANGRFHVLLCVTSNSARKYIDTGYLAMKGETVKVGGVRLGTIEYCDKKRGNTPYIQYKDNGALKLATRNEANRALRSLESKASAVIDNLGDSFTLTAFEKAFGMARTAEKKVTFAEYCNSVIEQYKTKERFQSAQILAYTLKQLAKYDPQLSKRGFRDINKTYLDGYKNYCEKTDKNGANTISIRLRALRIVFNQAIGEKIAPASCYPFNTEKSKVKANGTIIPASELNKQESYLPMESMRKLNNTEFDTNRLNVAKHLFLFSFHCRGINFMDMAGLTAADMEHYVYNDDTHEEIQQIIYTRKKTGKEIRVTINDQIRHELEWFRNNTLLHGEHILPIVHKDYEPEELNEFLRGYRKRLNMALKDIAEVLELPKSQQQITIYSARHSFAMALRENGQSIEVISAALDHDSVETTKAYVAKIAGSRLDNATNIQL